MAPHFPAEDPSCSGSFAERTAAYVWGHVLLRWMLVLTLVNQVAALVIIAVGALSPAMAGLLVLLSVLTWFFAVVLPLMNREVRTNLGAPRHSYFSEVVEVFGRVVLFAQTTGCTALLIYAVA
ncbi:MAG: hypothetical protein ACYTGN_01920 [Planctomycetota bacterium]|jgi:hypothetical protein